MCMYYLIYASKSRGIIDEDQLEHILVHSTIFNKINAITGMLIYSDNHFLQLIEGNKEDVLNLWNAIQNDTRHTDIHKINEGVIEKRYFPDWTMGYKSANYMDLNLIEGYRNPNDVNHFQSSSVNILFKVLGTTGILTKIEEFDKAFSNLRRYTRLAH